MVTKAHLDQSPNKGFFPSRAAVGWVSRTRPLAAHRRGTAPLGGRGKLPARIPLMYIEGFLEEVSPGFLRWDISKRKVFKARDF